MEPSAAQMDDEEELMAIVAARSRGDNREAEFTKLEIFELAVQQAEDEQPNKEEMVKSFQSLQQHPPTAGDKSTGEEEIRKEEASLEGELVLPKRILPSGQNQSAEATMHPGAYAVAPQNTNIGLDQSTTPTDNNNGLAVANQVEENEEHTQIARLDHSHGKNRSTTMTLLISVLIGSLLIVGVVIGSVCRAGLCSNKEGDVETQAPTSFRYFVLEEDIQYRIEEAFGPHYFPENDEPEPTQPKLKALNWIVFENPLQLNPDANKLLQRFIVVLTYFQTSRESDWLDCGPSTTGNDETCWIQIADVDLLENQWLTGAHECQWGGCFCSGENITQLWLRNNGLNGPLLTELASLPALDRIDLQGNQLTGSVPSKYGSFPSLSYLDLRNNQLSGNIPLELFGNNKLSYILFRNNSLTGILPTEVGLFVGFGSNSLSGSLPTELFQAGKGNYLDLWFDDNLLLTGTLPTEIGALHGFNILKVFLQGNPLSGTIPLEIGLLKGSITELDVSWTNMELFTECTNLLLTRLEIFDISNNKFHGTIPAQLSALTSLHQFIVNGNELSGSIPSSVCALAVPTKDYFDVAAACLPRDGTGNPNVECSCCTLCCDGDAADYCLPKEGSVR
ncbi:leucine Rich Repeat [Seminavis robusta]|uniref:Leucine Rich Repeat n=1 Tax=Seminavis robusta TaxID=568900 RepID=A0A9N8HWE5_9STRA|nr:leucine Rich Repeat [Seminavis robusta]|eukprot:Sro2158_g316970.1 leucine Rich Repeat (620) ;mRNA; f:13041-15376